MTKKGRTKRTSGGEIEAKAVDSVEVGSGKREKSEWTVRDRIGIAGRLRGAIHIKQDTCDLGVLRRRLGFGARCVFVLPGSDPQRCGCLPPFAVSIANAMAWSPRESAQVFVTYGDKMSPVPILLYVLMVNNQNSPVEISEFQVQVLAARGKWIFPDTWEKTAETPVIPTNPSMERRNAIPTAHDEWPHA